MNSTAIPIQRTRSELQSSISLVSVPRIALSFPRRPWRSGGAPCAPASHRACGSTGAGPLVPPPRSLNGPVLPFRLFPYPFPRFRTRKSISLHTKPEPPVRFILLIRIRMCPYLINNISSSYERGQHLRGSDVYCFERAKAEVPTHLPTRYPAVPNPYPAPIHPHTHPPPTRLAACDLPPLFVALRGPGRVAGR